MSDVTITQTPDQSAPPESAIQITHITYALFALGLLSAGLIAVAGLVVAYIKRDDAPGSYLRAHFDWLISTFWWSVLWATLAWIFFFLFTLITLGIGIVIAWIPLTIVWVWCAYRIIKGWLRLTEKRAV